MPDPIEPPAGSILRTVKRLVNVELDYDAFDEELFLHINSIFATLHQLGVGPKESAFYIENDQATWDQFISGKDNINSVKTYMGIKVRLLFDPPSTSFGIEAMKTQAQEFEWRLLVASEPPYVHNPNDDIQ